MNWCDERYVRSYVRDTPEWLALSYDAQCLFLQLLRKVDRAGVLELGRLGRRAVAVVLGRADLWPRLEPALEELVADGCVAVTGDRLVLPNFIEAQEAKQSDRVRQEESRARRRDQSRGGAPVTQRDNQSQNVTDCHTPSHAVTGGHTASQPVTPSVLCCAVPSVPSEDQKPLSACADGSAGSTPSPRNPAPQPTRDTALVVAGNGPQSDERPASAHLPLPVPVARPAASIAPVLSLVSEAPASGRKSVKRAAAALVVEPTGDEATVWAAYLAVSPRSRCTADRRDLIRRWLGTYSADELVRCVEGYGRSPHHNGQNDRGTKYLGLELMLRDPQHIEAGWRYRDEAQAPARGKPPPSSGVGINAAWAEIESEFDTRGDACAQ